MSLRLTRPSSESLASASMPAEEAVQRRAYLLADLRRRYPDQQPWLLASFAASALILASFAVIGTNLTGETSGRVTIPMMTAGWHPSARATRPYIAKPKTSTLHASVAMPAQAIVRAARVATSDNDPPPASPTLDAFVSEPLPGVLPPAVQESIEIEDPDSAVVTVDRGDTLSGILGEAGVQGDAIKAILVALKSVYEPSAIRAGEALTLKFGRPAGPEPRAGSGLQLMSLSFKPSIERDVVVARTDGGGYEAKEVIKKLTEKTDRATGVINGSLYQAAAAAGVPDGAIAAMIRIFSYDVDFQRDIQAGDKFDVLFTRYYDDEGTPVKAGTVLHATLTLGREKKSLYRFTNPDDQTTEYFNPEGWSGKRMLMKTPVDGARLSSGFGMRWHPVLGYNKMHKGVDFAAPKGTPVMAAGNGVIEVAGLAGAYGNYIRVRHSGPYKTAYAHLSRFARGMGPGTKVRQGQIIGYIGTTGRSTGPHLHYEVLLNNAQVSPNGVKVPTGTNLTGRALTAFRTEKTRLDTLKTKTPLVNAVATREAAPAARP